MNDIWIMFAIGAGSGFAAAIIIIVILYLFAMNEIDKKNRDGIN
jgi:hypothetical protein